MTAAIRLGIFLVVALLCQRPWQHARAQQVVLISDGVAVVSIEGEILDSSRVRHVIRLDIDNSILRITGNNVDWRFAILDAQKMENEDEAESREVWVMNAIDQKSDSYVIFLYKRQISEEQSVISMIAVFDKEDQSSIAFYDLKLL
ncbi:MAG: hypothetical protein KatS3mg033_1138 [Thermonema sp.]|uniref:hypothetical protein n=1 Tax=Thermonema sp. TaxID=2231181 RepID=UPI0021DCA460|nr:hypothetical protein [Thermonema sp.]GIV39338.1 MAG: hypothetical protein KatS3mg033_1138 [Thermonema sp.]